VKLDTEGFYEMLLSVSSFNILYIGTFSCHLTQTACTGKCNSSIGDGKYFIFRSRCLDVLWFSRKLDKSYDMNTFLL
jgi:hypothetical protein